MKTNAQIKAEQDCNRILETLLQYNEGLIWTARTFAELLGWSTQRARNAIKRLMATEMLITHSGEHWITDIGRDHYDECVKSGEIVLDVRSFKDEALTGIREKKSQRSGFKVSEESPLTNAALPGNPRVENSDNWIERKIAMAEEMGLDLQEFAEYWEKGLIAQCKGYGRPAHVGRFHKNEALGGRQDICIECTKIRRSERYGKKR